MWDREPGEAKRYSRSVFCPMKGFSSDMGAGVGYTCSALHRVYHWPVGDNRKREREVRLKMQSS